MRHSGIGTVTVGIGAIVALVTLAACSPAAPVEVPRSTVSIAPEPSTPSLPPAPEDPRPEVVWPLTGMDAEGVSAADLARPALAVKIENSAAARPQENLDKADVVFEEYVESGISRLVAVFHSDYPESIGPVRSMRPMDRFIMGSFGGPLVFSGAQPRFIRMAQKSGQVLITQDLGSYGFYRTSGRAAPHNLHAYPTKLAEQAADMPAPAEQWAFAYPEELATATQTGTPATHIDISMSSYAKPSWDWDAASSTWLRSEGGAPHVTMDGTQLAATNVVMLWVTVKYTSSEGGSSVPETILDGQSGDGYVVSGDRTIPITWSKAGQFDPWKLTAADGAPVVLSPGQTWFELVPNKGIGHGTSIDIS